MAPLSITLRLQMAFRHAIMATGLDLYQHTDDRRVLQTVILPHFARQPGITKVLFVGCAWYTRGYRRFFPPQAYWTLDSDPGRRRYGARQHVTDSLANVGVHFGEATLDLILCNGVFGWGLNAPAEVEQAFDGCYHSLRPRGVLVVGWNDIPERRPFPLEAVRSLQQISALVFPPLQSARYLTANPNRHTFDFYEKPDRAGR